MESTADFRPAHSGVIHQRQASRHYFVVYQAVFIEPRILEQGLNVLSAHKNRLTLVDFILFKILQNIGGFQEVEDTSYRGFNPEKSPFNMPELNWYLGYPFAIGIMAAIGVIMLFYFKKKKWL